MFHIPSWNLTVFASWKMQKVKFISVIIFKKQDSGCTTWGKYQFQKIRVMLTQIGGIFAFLSQCSSLDLDMFQVLVCARTHRGLHLVCSIFRRLLCNGLTARVQSQKCPHRVPKYRLLQLLLLLERAHVSWPPMTTTFATNRCGPRKEAVSRPAHSLAAAKPDLLWQAFKKLVHCLWPQMLLLKNIRL